MVDIAGPVGIRKLQIPRELAEKSNGFAIDIGGSVVKLVYLPKNAFDSDSDTVSLCMTTWDKDHIDEALDFIRNNVDIRRPEGGELPIIHATGIGSNQISVRIEKEFNIKLRNMIEFDCFILAVDFLRRNYPGTEVFADVRTESLREGLAQLSAKTSAMEHWVEIRNDSNFLIDMEKKDAVRAYLECAKETLDSGECGEHTGPPNYPYILGQLGSGFVYLKVYEDMTYKMIDLNSFGGKTFLGLGRLLTGAKTYQELIALAEEGNAERLNVRLCDVVQNVPGDVYSFGVKDETVIYSFGKAHGKDLADLRKADIARTLLEEICLNTLKLGVFVMTHENCRDLYLAGSFVGAQVTQDILTRLLEVLRAECMEQSNEKISTADLRMRILQNGGMLGALGSFVSGCHGPDSGKLK